jgi:hypothetical protein
MTAKLGLNFTPEIMEMGSTDQISEALIQTAVEQGKSEDEIATAMA